jgi:hypothetical protein
VVPWLVPYPKELQPEVESQAVEQSPTSSPAVAGTDSKKVESPL